MPTYKKEYTLSQLCKRFKRPEQTIWNWINEGKIEATKVNGYKWVVQSTELKKIEKLNENAKRYNKGWSKAPKNKSEAKPKRKYTKRKKSSVGRPRKSTAIEVQVPVVLENFCKELNFDLSNAVQSKVDDYCKELIDTLKQFK